MVSGASRTPSAPRPRPRAISATQLRSMWRSASQERGWSHPDDWWSPAVDAVTEAIITDGDVVERCNRLGLARANAGVSMAETVEDVLALARLVRALQAHPAHSFATPPGAIDVVVLIKSAAVGWAEAAHGGLGGGEPLASLAPAELLPGARYLTQRLREVDAESRAHGDRLGRRYALVVAALPGPAAGVPDPLAMQARLVAWDRVRQLSQLADALRSMFSAGESIVRLGPSTAGVLVRRTPELPARVSDLRALIEGQQDAPDVRIWIERLPDTLQQAVQLLADLRR